MWCPISKRLKREKAGRVTPVVFVAVDDVSQFLFLNKNYKYEKNDFFSKIK